MRLIATQPYIKVIREVTSVEKKEVEQERILYLYEDKVVTEYREFPLKIVLDMSYRRIGSAGGLLFLHTTKGMYAYTVKTETSTFINAFHAFKNKEI
ncbi:hypothetical protein ACLIBH_05740 [Virgibacillus sp. W0430]|uniref:hypothetical protein n=1 Tax=Virgibacillus sp. W0430 TaxID=3391580 RepID=UPI003F47E1B9